MQGLFGLIGLPAGEQHLASRDLLEDAPLRCDWRAVRRICADDPHRLRRTAGIKEATQLDLPEGERVDQHGPAADAMEKPAAVRKCLVEQLYVALLTRGTGQQGEGGAARFSVGREMSRSLQACQCR